MRLEKRIALVTGGASGIGAATVRRLAAEGARVAVADLNLDGARSVAGEVDGAAFAMDVADAASVREAVAAAETELGPLDVLVNNAGTDRFAFFVNTDEELWDFVLGVNLRGVLASSRLNGHQFCPGRRDFAGRYGEQKRRKWICGCQLEQPGLLSICEPLLLRERLHSLEFFCQRQELLK